MEDQRICIKLCVKNGFKGAEIFWMLQTAYGDAVMSRRRVFEWYKRFKEGREETADNGHSGRPSTSTTPEKVDKVLELDILGVRRRLNAVIVPKDLTFDQKNARKETASLNLEATTDDPELLKRVITGDETWIYGFDSETAQQASEWRFKNEQRPKKARKAPSKVKVMLTEFFDYQGIILHEFQQQGSTITADSYLGVLRRLREVIRQKQPELWRSKSWILHHDNALAHTALKISKFLQDYSTSVFPQPPYSPDLAPSDFFLFGKLKKKLKGRKFQSIEEIKVESKKAMKAIPAPSGAIPLYQLCTGKEALSWHQPVGWEKGRDAHPSLTLEDRGVERRLCVFVLASGCHWLISSEASHGVIPSSYFSLQENNQWMVADVEAETFAPGTSAQQVYKLLLQGSHSRDTEELRLATTSSYLLTKLVEVKRWGSHIPNYLLQNVVKHENVLEHAKETSLGQAFIEALKVLQTALTSNQLPHYQKGWNLMTNLVPKNAPRAAMKSDIENIIKYSLTSPLWVENMLKGNRSPTPYPPLDKLDIIMKQTTMDDTLKQQNISVITKMVQLIVDNAQRDEIFESLFSRVEYTGSYYENLRVWTADEYDIDFIFNFPVYSFELVDVPQLSVYKKLRVPNVEEEYSKKAKFIKAKTKFLTFFSDSGFLLRDRFINWFNSIVDKVLLTFPLGQLKIKTAMITMVKTLDSRQP
ncbi:hypothetical protein LAZ67_22000970 [Cordylochernes scorpioides]|uniref:Transposase n=1 Tax=Cordylochernes scorpioides TaxID=51811 RepID=A0ABY6LRN6_9ARAC|nr:hypothetical protein LAZ67_22000970 [Cordylochernes scorpioides]